MFRIKSQHLSLFLITLFIITGTSQSWALRSDREQPIDIRADRVEINEKEEVSQYIGNVNLKQGTLNIKADKITVYLDNGKLTRIVIKGNPATFKQKPEDNKDVVTSKARHMEYFASKEHLVLKDNAQVIQGANRFQGDFIEYDTLNSTVKAKKGEGSDSRVHAIIQPAKSDPEKQDPAEQDQPRAPSPK